MDISIVLIILLFVVQIIVCCFLVSLNMKYQRLKKSYNSFMRGKDGKTLEESVLEQLEGIDTIKNVVQKNRQDIKDLRRTLDGKYQRTGIVKYDAFHEMGGKLSFALVMLDKNNTGHVINAMHSREGCYIYIKEIIKGESYIPLGDEENKALDKALGNDVQ